MNAAGLVSMLNDLLKEDRQAISTLFLTRVKTNEQLFNSEQPVFIRMDRTISPLGIINGMWHTRDDGRGLVSMMVDNETGLIERFEISRE